MTRYIHTMCMAFGTDGEPDRIEIDATFDYEVDWGRPATAAHYHMDALPAVPARITDYRVLKIDGVPVAVVDADLHDRIVDALEEGRFDDHLIERASKLERIQVDNARQEIAA